jgi:hypothetical protein
MSVLGRFSEAQQRKIAGIAIGVLALVVAWHFASPAIAGFLDFAQFERSIKAKEADPLDAFQLVDVRIDALTRSVSDFSPKRNIFGFGPEPPPPPPPPRPVVRLPPPEPPRIEPVVPREPQPPPVTMKLIGIFGPKDRRIAVLSENNEVINAVVGDVIRNAFIVREIGYQTVEFGFVGFPEDKTARIDMGSP